MKVRAALLGWAWRSVAIGAALAVSCPTLSQEAESKLTIEGLLKDGWQAAGYTSAVDNWSTFILFQNPHEQYLIQCRAGYDVTRKQHVQTNCYRLR
jgi:hypothetical protein